MDLKIHFKCRNFQIDTFYRFDDFGIYRNVHYYTIFQVCLTFKKCLNIVRKVQEKSTKPFSRSHSSKAISHVRKIQGFETLCVCTFHES